jgi:tetratricopeptide (TPR) repeat protein
MAAAERQTGWILSSFWDSLLFIGSPVVAIVLFVPLRTFFSSSAISLFLLAFFTFGHHLPGFLRAYGDRELFARYRWRFLLAPPLVFGATMWFDARGLHGLLFAVFTWDIWHVLMQHYGFLRIYDAKQGDTSPLSARLDWAVSLSWYAAFIALSPHYRHDLLFRAYSSGVPLLPPAVVRSATTGLVAVSIAISALYLIYHLDRWRKGRALNLRKLVTLAIFLGATWFLYVRLNDFVVGFAVWSAFHCLQYFGIVWAFNQNRVRRGAAVTRFLRFLFRPSAGLVALYAALILAYGAINYATHLPANPTVGRVLMVFVITSGVLHYYYDGFIWKVRESDTRRYLNIAGGGLGPAMRWRRAVPQTAVYALVLIGLGWLETRRPNPEAAVRQSLVLHSPEVASAHLHLGDSLRREGRLEEALAAYRRGGEEAQARHGMGLALAALGRPGEALEAFEEAARLDPKMREAHYNAGQILNKLGLESLQRGDRTRALAIFRRAAAAAPGDAGIQVNLGNLLLLEGKLREAKERFEAALAVDPSHAMARNNLGLALLREGRPDEARLHLEYASRHGDETVRASARQALGLH